MENNETGPARRGRPLKCGRKPKQDWLSSTPPTEAAADNHAGDGLVLGTALDRHAQQLYDFLLVLLHSSLTVLLAMLREQLVILRWLLNHMLPKPLAILLFCFGFMLCVSSFLPIFCLVPGVPFSNRRCVTPAFNANGTEAPPSNAIFIAENNKLYGQVIKHAAPLKNLLYELTYTETALRDVRNKLVVSSLPASPREPIVREFDGYIDWIGSIMDILHTFAANLLGTIDRVLINTEWTLFELNRLEASCRPHNFLDQAALWTQDHLIGPTCGLYRCKGVAGKSAKQIKKHIDDMEPDLSRLIIDAQVLVANFKVRPPPLENIKLMSAIDGQRVVDERTKLKAQRWSWDRLWALVGGEQDAMGGYGRQLDMLQKVDWVIDEGLNSVLNLLVDLRSTNAQTRTWRETLLRSRDRHDIPDRRDLVEIVIGVKQLRTLQSVGRAEIEEIRRDHSMTGQTRDRPLSYRTVVNYL